MMLGDIISGEQRIQHKTKRDHPHVMFCSSNTRKNISTVNANIFFFNISKLLPEFIIVAVLLAIDLGQIIISVTLP